MDQNVEFLSGKSLPDAAEQSDTIKRNPRGVEAPI